MIHSNYQRELAPLSSLPEVDLQTPILAEGYETYAVANLDVFFSRIYRYWNGKGATPILLCGALNLAALAFTIAFSAFLLLYVNWAALHSECVVKDTCDLAAVAVFKNLKVALAARGPLLDALILTYLSLFGAYWAWTAAHYVGEARDLSEVRHFVNNKLGIGERQIQTMTWAEVVHKLVLVQRSSRLCIARDLNEHDIVSRIMRKDNYLIAMLNKGVLRLSAPLPGMRRRFSLTKTLEWNLRWVVLDHLFDERFRIRSDFLSDPEKLRRRLRIMAVVNAALSPFLFAFLLIYFFMRNAERFYSHPGAISARRWSSLAKWRLREFNELPHYLSHRLNSSHAAAVKYVGQFPSHTMANIARFVAFVTGSFTALLLLVTALDETLLERPLLGRHLVWWLAATGIVLTASRALVSDEPVAYDPERAMVAVSEHTHHLPRHWRGRAHTDEVHAAFSAMFQLQVLLFLEEMASLALTPFVLYYSLPACSDDIIDFVRDFTVHVEGVGDVCSLAAFDLQRHGNAKYGAPAHSLKHARSRQGKLEKSFLTFAATYPTWTPDSDGEELLASLHAHATAATAYPHSPVTAGAPHAYGAMSPHQHTYSNGCPQSGLYVYPNAQAPSGSAYCGHGGRYGYDSWGAVGGGGMHGWGAAVPGAGGSSSHHSCEGHATSELEGAVQEGGGWYAQGAEEHPDAGRARHGNLGGGGGAAAAAKHAAAHGGDGVKCSGGDSHHLAGPAKPGHDRLASAAPGLQLDQLNHVHRPLLGQAGHAQSTSVPWGSYSAHGLSSRHSAQGLSSHYQASARGSTGRRGGLARYSPLKPGRGALQQVRGSVRGSPQEGVQWGSESQSSGLQPQLQERRTARDSHGVAGDMESGFLKPGQWWRQQQQKQGQQRQHQEHPQQQQQQQQQQQHASRLQPGSATASAACAGSLQTAARTAGGGGGVSSGNSMLLPRPNRIGPSQSLRVKLVHQQQELLPLLSTGNRDGRGGSSSCSSDSETSCSSKQRGQPCSDGVHPTGPTFDPLDGDGSGAPTCPPNVADSNCLVTPAVPDSYRWGRYYAPLDPSGSSSHNAGSGSSSAAGPGTSTTAGASGSSSAEVGHPLTDSEAQKLLHQQQQVLQLHVAADPAAHAAPEQQRMSEQWQQQQQSPAPWCPLHNPLQLQEGSHASVAYDEDLMAFELLSNSPAVAGALPCEQNGRSPQASQDGGPAYTAHLLPHSHAGQGNIQQQQGAARQPCRATEPLPASRQHKHLALQSKQHSQPQEQLMQATQQHSPKQDESLSPSQQQQDAVRAQNAPHASTKPEQSLIEQRHGTSSPFLDLLAGSSSSSSNTGVHIGSGTFSMDSGSLADLPHRSALTVSSRQQLGNPVQQQSSAQQPSRWGGEKADVQASWSFSSLPRPTPHPQDACDALQPWSQQLDHTSLQQHHLPHTATTTSLAQAHLSAYRPPTAPTSPVVAPAHLESQQSMDLLDTFVDLPAQTCSMPDPTQPSQGMRASDAEGIRLVDGATSPAAWEHVALHSPSPPPHGQSMQNHALHQQHHHPHQQPVDSPFIQSDLPPRPHHIQQQVQSQWQPRWVHSGMQAAPFLTAPSTSSSVFGSQAPHIMLDSAAAGASFFGVSAPCNLLTASAAAGPGSILGSVSGSGSGVILPANEVVELRERIAAGHTLMQSFYMGADVTVQHRMQNQAHSRSYMGGRNSFSRV